METRGINATDVVKTIERLNYVDKQACIEVFLYARSVLTTRLRSTATL